MSDKSNAGVMNVIRTSIAKEGWLFFYKGAVPAWIRLQPTTIVSGTLPSFCIARRDLNHFHPDSSHILLLSGHLCSLRSFLISAPLLRLLGPSYRLRSDFLFGPGRRQEKSVSSGIQAPPPECLG